MREKKAKEMSGEEQLPEERLKRVGMSESLWGRRSEEITQSNAFSSQGSEVLFDPRKNNGN